MSKLTMNCYMSISNYMTAPPDTNCSALCQINLMGSIKLISCNARVVCSLKIWMAGTSLELIGNPCHDVTSIFFNFVWFHRLQIWMADILLLIIIIYPSWIFKLMNWKTRHYMSIWSSIEWLERNRKHILNDRINNRKETMQLSS